MRLEIETLGEKAVARDLIGIGARAVDIEPAMGDVADELRRATVRQFDSQGAYGSGGWEPLAASTVEQKRQAGLDPRILHATRRLRDSLTESGHPDAVVVPSRDGLSFGTTVPYAGYHQHGRGVPRRRPLQLPEAVRRAVVRIVQAHVIGTDPARTRGVA